MSRWVQPMCATVLIPSSRRRLSVARIGRPGLSAVKKKEVWARWKAGESLSEIGGALGKHAGSIYGVLNANGGVMPAGRTRSRLALTLSDREEISRGLAAGSSMQEIAQQLGRPASTVSREIRRNAGPDQYRAGRADERAWQQTTRPKRCRLAASEPLRLLVAEKFRADWSVK